MTFSDLKKTAIENLEQIGYTHSERSAFPRNIARYINGTNSLRKYNNATSDSLYVIIF